MTVPITRRDFVERAALACAVSSSFSAARRSWLAERPATQGGVARFVSDGDEFAIANDALEATWSVAGGSLRAIRFRDKLGRRDLTLPADVFSVTLRDGTAIGASSLRVLGAPRVERLTANPSASRFAERLGGQQVVVTLADMGGRVQAEWRGALRDGSRYVRQEMTLPARGADLPVREVTLVDLRAPGAAVSGTVRGSPVIWGTMFLGLEHPLSASTVEEGRVRCVLTRELPLRPGVPLVVSSVIGVTPEGQLRRGFLEYVERERAHPYRTFLHYNSWYDLGYFSRYDEAGALAVINAFGTELHVRRGVTLDSFLFDDGWDDPQTLWQFHSGFPRGFVPLREAAARFGAAPGVWLSPWGGYGGPRQERLRYGRERGFEINEGGFALSGPNYYRRFRDTCLDMIHTAGVNQFKIDGTGNVNAAIPGSEFGSDFDAAIALIGELRAEKPDLYVNLTTGTYPSPFWLRYADSIWRGGEDHDFTGMGPDRQRWITYRDADTYAGVVRRGPLFPLNSLMLHGLIYAQHARGLTNDPTGAFGAEVRSYFGTGTQLQEMYVTPALLTPANWDAIAEAAKWSRRNAGALRDTHWVGGDPAQLETYGWASWTPEKGIVTIRNPRPEEQLFTLDIGSAFELPERAPPRYSAQSPWEADRGRAPILLQSGVPHTFDLGPFEVLTLEATPAR